MAPPTIAQRRQSSAIALPNNGGPSNRDSRPNTATGPSSPATPLVKVVENRSQSPEIEEDVDAEGEEEEEEGGGARKGRSKKRKIANENSATNGPTGGAAAELAGKADYKYTSEISQMVSWLDDLRRRNL